MDTGGGLKFSRPSRPATPDSYLSSTLDHATHTIDDLTQALSNISRVPSPELPLALTCCCGREASQCENLKNWLLLKGKLESRLTLSAEVGQALLQRHEAYVRRVEAQGRRTEQADTNDSDDTMSIQTDTEGRVTDLLARNAALEQRLAQALVNNEVTEVSNRTILQELQDAKETISRLSAHHAKSTGWENRLANAVKERDDLQQERDSESQRARLAESRFAALKEKTSKLQADVRRLQDELRRKQMHRMESSETILQDARTRLTALQESLGGSISDTEQVELNRALETLVDENDALKRDNAELQSFLADTREELRSTQEEFEEYRLNPPLSANRPGLASPHGSFRQHQYRGSMPASSLKDMMNNFSFREASLERKNRRYPHEPSTPDTTHRPLSPESLIDSKRTSFSQPQPRYPQSPLAFSFQENEDDGEPTSPEKPKTHRSLLLLTRSRGVQTDNPQGLLSPSPGPTVTHSPSHPSTPSPDPRSEASSFSENSTTSNMAQLLERVTSYMTRLQEADALTLMNRLKRHNLRGDVAHLSRTTINTILLEVGGLRNQFRYLLEDEKTVIACTRKDLRTLFKLFKEMFTEMGELRIDLNDIIIDPSRATTISEHALNPSKRERLSTPEQSGPQGGGWIAPISKLFGSPAPGSGTGSSGGAGPSASNLYRSTSGRTPTRPPPRFVPKLQPALSASATTVNVEFSGSGVRSTSARHHGGDSIPRSAASSYVGSSNVMGIFAGAPAPKDTSWVVVDNPGGYGVRDRRLSALRSPQGVGTPRPHALAARHNPNRLSRNVDAIIDIAGTGQGAGDGDEEEEADYIAPLLQRTLRHRGLSDSSIHSTFMEHGEQDNSMPQHTYRPPPVQGILPDRGSSMLQGLARKVQNLTRLSAAVHVAAQSPSSGSDAGTSPPSTSGMPSGTPRDRKVSQGSKSASSNTGFSSLLPGLTTAWVDSGSMIDPVLGAEPFPVGSPREESAMHQRMREKNGFISTRDLY